MGEDDPRDEGQARALPPEVAGRLSELAQALFAVENATAFYPPGHQARQPPLARFLQALGGLLAERGALTLGFAEDELAWEGAFHRDLPPVLRKLVELALTLGIARITWAEGATAAEVEAFAQRIARRRGAGERRPWDAEEPLEHIQVEGFDYSALVADEHEGEREGRRRLWRALLLRCLGEAVAVFSEEEVALIREQWEDPAALAQVVVDALGPEAAANPTAAVEPLRRLAAAFEEAARRGGGSEEEIVARLREVARHLPEGLRFQLIESSLERAGDGFFARAFASPRREELVGLLAHNFAMDPDQILRLTRVFQHLVPRQLERMELAHLVRDRLHEEEAAEERLPENAWDEVQELLTGEAGDFMSDAYRELLRRLAAREEERREAESSLAALVGLARDIEQARTGEETLAIRLELLGLATSPERFGETLAALSGRCRVAWSTGDRAHGLAILRGIAELPGAPGGAPGPAGAVDAALREIVAPETAGELLRALAEADADDAALIGGLLRGAPAAVAGPLLEALAAERSPERRRPLAALASTLGAALVPEALRRLPAAAPEEARALVALLGEARDPAAVPGLLALLGREAPKLRRDAVRALVRIDSAEARRALPQLLADPDEEVAQIAATHLGAVGGRDAAAGLLRSLEGGVFTGLRAGGMKRAITALGHMRATAAVVPLAELLRRRTWVSRRAQEELGEAAVTALARIGGAEARRALEQAAASGPPGVAALCRRLLARWSGT
jgi:HEAT repeat protein